MLRDVHFESDSHAIVMTLPPSEGPAPDRIVIDDTHFLFTAHFKKAGPDLILTDDSGKKLVLVGYFSLEKRPDLVSPDGATMSADLVARLAGPDAPGQYAQSGAPAGAQVIGRVEIVGGFATVQHANGVVENLKAGDALLKGDVVMTGDSSSLTLSLNDGTAFNMGASGRMVLTELIYNSSSKSNSAFISLVKGTFTFVAGQVAHTGDMRVSTPVATMGIRGTTIGSYLDADVTGNIYQFTATLLDDPGGGSGRYDVLDPVTGVVLYTVRSTATQVSFRAAPNNQILVQEAPKSAAILQHEIAISQILFPIFLANPANVQAGQPTPQPRNDTLTPPQDLPQPPAGIDPQIQLQLTLFTTTTATTDKTTTSSNPHILITPDLTTPPTIASISIAPIAGNNIVNLQRAQAGFLIAGSESGADGQTVTIKIFDANGNIVGSYTTTATGGSWTVNVAPAVALALADGTYTVQATVSDADGNPVTPATRVITVDETPPPPPGVALTADSGSSPTDHITNNGTLTLAGIESGALVEYSVDGGATWSTSFAALKGANTVLVRQTDAAGNVSGVTTLSFTLDTIAPAAPGVALASDSGSSAADHITNTGALTLAGIETGALVEYSVDGGATWGSAFTAVEGPNAVLVRQTDVAGNVSGVTAFSFTLDTIAPAAPGVTLTSDSGRSAADHITNSGALTLAGIEIGALLEYSIDGGETWSNSFTAVEGANTVAVRQTDAAGNVSPATTFSFTLDTHTPVAPGVALTSDSGTSATDHVTNNGALTLAGIESSALVEYSIDGGATWSSSFAPVAGANTVAVRQTDLAGNVSGFTTFSFTLDTSKPPAPGVALTSDSGRSTTDHITNTSALSLSGIETGALVEYSVNGGATWSSAFAAVEGSNTVLVRQTDLAGNVSSATTFSFTLDTHSPGAPGVALTADSGSSASDHISNTGALTLSGIESGAVVEYSINGGTTWSNSFTATEGANTVLVRQTDVAGNVSGVTTFSFVLDTSQPPAPGVALTTDSGRSAIDHITNTGALSLSGIETGALVEYSVNGGATWSSSFAPIEGSNTILVRQTDLAGNISTATSFSFTLDTHAPATPGVVLTTDSGASATDHITNSGALTISGIETSATVEYSTDGGTTWSNSITAAEGANTVMVRQTDVAGNVSAATSFSFTLDTHTPPAPGVALTTDSGSSASDHITNSGALTLSGIETGALVEYSIDGGETWSNSFTAAEGANAVLVRQTDVAGNMSGVTSFSFTLDTVAPTIAVSPVGEDNIVNAGEAAAGFAINGIESGADGQIVTVRILDDGGNVVRSYATTAAAGTWSVTVSSADATALADGTYTVTASVSDQAGNPATPASRTLTVDETAPTIAIAAITGDNFINLSEAEAGFVIGGTATGADGRIVTITILDSDGDVVRNYTATAASGTWSVNVSAADATALADGAYTVTASVTDAAGNPATPAVQTLTVEEDTDTWTSASNGNWSAASHWSNGVPTADTDVVISTAGTYTISISQPAVARTLTIEAATVEVKDNAGLTLTGDLNLVSGTFTLNNGSLQATSILIGLAAIFFVEHGHYAFSMPIENDGQFIIDNNSTVVDITGELSGTGSFSVLSNATLQFSGGTHTISGATTNNGTIEVTDGTLVFAGTLSGTGSLQIDSGATLQLNGADSLEVVFAGTAGTLILKDPTSFTGTISGLNDDDRIDLANINWMTAQVSSVTYSPSTNITTLVVTDGTHTDTIQLAGDYTASSWTFSSDGSGGTILVDPMNAIAALNAIEQPAAGETIVATLDAAEPSRAIASHDAVTTAGATDPARAASGDAASTASEFAGDAVQSEFASTGYFGRTTTGLLGGAEADDLSSMTALQDLLDDLTTVTHDHAAHQLLPAWVAKLLSGNMASTAGDPVTAHVHFGGVETINYGLDPQITELLTQAALHGPPDTPPGQSEDHGADQSLPPGHINHQDADQAWSVPGFDKPSKGSSPGTHQSAAGDSKADAGAADLPTEIASLEPAQEPPGHAKHDPVDQPSSIPGFDKPDKGSSPATHHDATGDNKADSQAPDLPTDVASHEPAHIPPGHAKDDRVEQPSSVPGFDKPDKGSSPATSHSAPGDSHAPDLPTDVASHEPAHIPPGHAKDDRVEQPSSVPGFDKPDKGSSPATSHSAPGDSHAPDLPTEIASLEPPHAPPGHAKDDDVGSSAPVFDALAGMTSPKDDQFPFGDAHGNSHKIELPAPTASLGPLGTPAAIATHDASGALPASPALDAIADHIAAPASDHFHFGNPADLQSIVLPGPAAPDYMAPLPTDQFQFSDLKNGHNGPVGHLAEFDPPAAPVQILIAATTAPDHSLSASANDASMVPGLDIGSWHAHQGAHGGTA